MKKKMLYIIAVSVLVLAASAAMAQVQTFKQQGGGTLPPPPVEDVGPTNYYPNATGTITRSGYTYKYRYPKIAGVDATVAVQLYNAESKYLDVEWGYKDGTKMNEGEALGYYRDPYYFNYSSQTYDQLRAIVAGCFTSQQKTELRESTMIVQALIYPYTGRVIDVYFSFRRSLPLVNVPVETFRSIELAIKEKLTITATTNGMKFNFLEFIWQQEF